MANFFITWSPGFHADSQTIQYKLLNEDDSAYIDLATVANEIDTYYATGFDDDIAYTFRILGDGCDVISEPRNVINITCPTVTLTPGTGTIDYSFSPASSADLKRYTVQLYKDGILYTSQINNQTFPDPITGQFAGLDENGIYRVKLLIESWVLTPEEQYITKDCEFSSVQSALCVNITDIQATVSETGTVTITLIKLDFNQQAHSNQIVHIAYRLASDPDIDGSYVDLPDATVGVNGNIISPSPYTVSIPESSIVLKVYNDCDGESSFSKTFTICEPVTLTASITGQCATGYIISPDRTYCYKEDIKDADCTVPAGTNEACHYNDSVYGEFGVIFYKIDGYNTNGTWTAVANRLATANYGGSYANTVWANPSSNTTDGRLNVTGLWLCGDQTYNTTPLGFTRQINIAESKYYYIGVGADNFASIKINGVTVVTQDEAAINTQNSIGSSGTFKFWHVYPVFLNAGSNILELTGTNSTTVGIVGLEIYDATEAELIAVTTELELTDLTVFSTKDIVDNDPFDVGNCNCDAYDGYTVVYDDIDLIYKCKKILTATPF